MKHNSKKQYLIDRKNYIWNQCSKIKGKNPYIYRKDRMGNLIKYSEYGKPTLLGWDIDHKYPRSRGGTNQWENLQGLHSMTNRLLKSNKTHWGYNETYGVTPNYYFNKYYRY